MKKIISTFITLSLLLSSGSFAQQAIKNEFKTINRITGSELHQTNDLLYPKGDVHKIEAKKAGKSISWNWDTVVSYDNSDANYNRYIQTFDVYGNVITQTGQSWNNNAWVNGSKVIYTYDANGNNLTETDQQWQSTTWVNSGKYTYTYDTNNNMLTCLIDQWQTNKWQPYSRQTWTYNSKGSMTTNLYELWQSNGQSYTIWWRDTLTFKIAGDTLHQRFRQSWQSNAWVSYERHTYTFDANGNLTLLINENWQTDAWVYNNKDSLTWDADGNMLQETDLNWQSNAWVNSSRWTYTNDANGNNLTLLKENWLNSAWSNYYRYTYTFNADNNSITGKCEFPDNSNFGWMDIYSDKTWKGNVLGHTYIAHWKAFQTGISKLTNNNEQLKVYPDPTDENLTLELKNHKTSLVKAELFNVIGDKLKSEIITQPVSIMNISSLPNGIYILNVASSDFSASKKIIIKH